jgi:hypothetical protein
LHIPLCSCAYLLEKNMGLLLTDTSLLPGQQTPLCKGYRLGSKQPGPTGLQQYLNHPADWDKPWISGGAPKTSQWHLLSCTGPWAFICAPYGWSTRDGFHRWLSPEGYWCVHTNALAYKLGSWFACTQEYLARLGSLSSTPGSKFLCHA